MMYKAGIKLEVVPPEPEGDDLSVSEQSGIPPKWFDRWWKEKLKHPIRADMFSLPEDDDLLALN